MMGSWKNRDGEERAWMWDDGVIHIDTMNELTAEEAQSLAEWLLEASGYREVQIAQC